MVVANVVIGYSCKEFTGRVNLVVRPAGKPVQHLIVYEDGDKGEGTRPMTLSLSFPPKPSTSLKYNWRSTQLTHPGECLGRQDLGLAVP